MKKIHFHSLDALRFLAFLKVFLLHLPAGGELEVFQFFKRGGGIGVVFFFVLSGFLITFIITKQKIKGDFHYGKFLGRRFLRIMPLYLLVCLVMFLIPEEFSRRVGFYMTGGYKMDWWYTLTFFENYRIIDIDGPPGLSPFPVFWSLCVEIHFYIVWGICLWFVRVKQIPYIAFFVIVLAIVMRVLELHYFRVGANMDTSDLLTNFDAFAIGGLLGYWLARENKLLISLVTDNQKWWRFLLAFFTLIIVILQNQLLPSNPLELYITKYVFVSVVFALCIMVFINNDIFVIRWKWLEYLGKISYGLYVFHIIFIHAGFQYYLDNGISVSDGWNVLLLGAGTMACTISLSVLTYELFEKPFIKLKDRLF